MIADPDTRLKGRETFVRLGDDRLFVDNTDYGTDARILSCRLNAEGLQVLFRNIVGVGIKRFEHAVDASVNQLSGIHFIHIVGIDLFKKSSKNIKAFGNVEIPFSGPCKGQECKSARGHYYKSDLNFSHRAYSIEAVQA